MPPIIPTTPYGFPAGTFTGYDFFLSRLTTTVSSRTRIHQKMEALTLTYSKVISRARAIADRTSDGGAAREFFHVDLVVKISRPDPKEIAEDKFLARAVKHLPQALFAQDSLGSIRPDHHDHFMGWGSG